MKKGLQKFIYIVRGNEEETYEIFKKRIFHLLNEILEKESIFSLKVVLTLKPASRMSVIPFRKGKIAVISVLQNDEIWFSEITNSEGYSGHYNVEEALPVSYKINWKDGTQTPGVCLLTLFNKKSDINRKAFLDIWHNSHTPLSLRIHPLWNYNRNVVLDKNLKNRENWDGIVEEQFRTTQSLLNPFLFFGNIFIIIPNMIKVYLDTKSFLDYKTIEPYLAHEYHMKRGL